MSSDDIKFTFKALTQEDLPLIYQWFQEPTVSAWWPTPKKEEEFFSDFLKRIRSKHTFPFLVLLNNMPLGYIQYYLIDKKKNKWLPKLPDYTVGTDQFIGKPEYLGKGYGTLFIKAFINYLSKLDKRIKTIIVDPDPSNLAAIRCYEKVGFKKIGKFQAPWGPALVMCYDLN